METNGRDDWHSNVEERVQHPAWSCMTGCSRYSGFSQEVLPLLAKVCGKDTDGLWAEFVAEQR